MTLDKVKIRQIVEITETTNLRLMEMGFVPGQSVTIIREAPLGDPIEISIMNYNICMRRKDASNIKVKKFNCGLI